MGCDIHPHIERREGDKWRFVESPNIPRNYDLFAILANVRNYGRATDKRDVFRPISLPKGHLPPDASREVREAYGDYECDWHSTNWLTLAEILAFDWTQEAEPDGWVNGPEYWDWRRWHKGRKESPDGCCGGVSGPNIKHVSLEEMEQLMEAIEKTTPHWCDQQAAVKATLMDTYCLLTWPEPYHRCCSEFWSEVIPRMAAQGKPEDVRLVFWFDS